MNKEEYLKLVKSKVPKEPKLKNATAAFLTGGLIGFIGEVIINILMTSFGLSRVDSSFYLVIIIIVLATFLTAIGKFDNLVMKAKCGLVVPTTGFAHSVQACALDYKKDGFITGIGSNFFKLAGSVILYGIVSAIIFIVIEVMIHG